MEKLSDHLELVRQYPNYKLNKYILFEYTKGLTCKFMYAPLNFSSCTTTQTGYRYN